MLALTKVNRNRTEADVANFLAEQKVSYPVAKESGNCQPGTSR